MATSTHSPGVGVLAALEGGGFYTYQTLENMVGCKISNTTEILPEYQHPEVGDQVYLHPTAPPLRIEIVDPPHTLVLFGSPAAVISPPGGQPGSLSGASPSNPSHS